MIAVQHLLVEDVLINRHEAFLFLVVSLVGVVWGCMELDNQPGSLCTVYRLESIQGPLVLRSALVERNVAANITRHCTLSNAWVYAVFSAIA